MRKQTLFSLIAIVPMALIANIRFRKRVAKARLDHEYGENFIVGIGTGGH